MSLFDDIEYESESLDSSEEDSEHENAREILNFCDKITEELRFCFKRNAGSDDYCDDIYEDRFKTPRSGRHSYYADILAVAQLNQKQDIGPNLARSPDGSKKEGVIIHPSNWTCSGLWDPSIGTGPLEELFRVLEDFPEFSRHPNSDNASTFYPQEWTVNSNFCSPYADELIGIGSIDTIYPSFIDGFHRYNNDSFTSLSPTNNNNFVSPDYHPSF